MADPERNDTSRTDEEVRARSAQQRNITAPTPPDVEVRARSAQQRNITAPTPPDVEEKGREDEEEPPEPPAADTRAP